MNASLIILQSFPVPLPTTNPYLVQLARGLRDFPDMTVLNFSWRVALLAKYDVFHVHWPEILVNGHSPLKKLRRQVLTLALLARLSVTRTPIVRTIHNLERPEGISVREKLLLRLLDRRTTLYIRLNSQTPPPDGRPCVTIPHGHYRDWFSGFPTADPVPGQISYVGLIRRYKGVEDLINAFRATAQDHPRLSLRLGGNPSTPGLSEKMATLSQGDERIRLNLNYLSDAELVEIVSSAQLVILPYRSMHNSGGVLAALSLGRPVLVPANDVNTALADEVGSGWVYQYTGRLTAEKIVETVSAVAAAGSQPPPNLTARDWYQGSLAHRNAYKQALTSSVTRMQQPQGGSSL